MSSVFNQDSNGKKLVIRLAYVRDFIVVFFNFPDNSFKSVTVRVCVRLCVNESLFEKNKCKLLKTSNSISVINKIIELTLLDPKVTWIPTYKHSYIEIVRNVLHAYHNAPHQRWEELTRNGRSFCSV